jgi:hypothetical protein
VQIGDFPKMNLCPVSRCDVFALFEQTESLQIPYKSHQLCFFNSYQIDILNNPFGTKDPAMLFGFCQRAVGKTLVRGPQNPSSLGRQAALKSEAESSLEFLETVRIRHDP